MDAPDYERIWLQNREDGEASGEGRLWCEDKVWPVDENDGEPTEYVRADLYARLVAENEKLRAAISWIEPPFVDDTTPKAEMLSRIQFTVDDARRAALSGGKDGE